jgi:uncharacterized protein (TIGR03435 family)
MRSAALYLLLAAAIGVAAPAQTPAPAKFAAFSIKPWHQGEAPVSANEFFYGDPAGLHIRFQPLLNMICYAYGIDRFQLTGGPDWVYGRPGPNGTRYDADATTGAPATGDQQRAMLREALAERFGLELSIATKPTEVLALVVAPGGPKLRKLDPGDTMPGFSTTADQETRTSEFDSIGRFVTRMNNIGSQPSSGGTWWTRPD